MSYLNYRNIYRDKETGKFIREPKREPIKYLPKCFIEALYNKKYYECTRYCRLWEICKKESQ